MAAQTIHVDYQPNKKQMLFHQSTADECLYGGAKGGGKSHALVLDTFRYVMTYQGALAYLFRETYDDLEANIIYTWKMEVPEQLYKYNASKHEVYMKNGSIVKFRYVRNHSDAESYQGRSIDYIGVDELTKHEEDTIQELLSCLRSPRYGYPPIFRATANPGGIGHVWVKKRYITGTNYGNLMYEAANGNNIQFIPATVYDNDMMMKNDPKYVKRLENLPEDKKKAFLYGDWDTYQGQAFPEWDESIHVCEPFEIPSNWRKWRCLDNGYTDPFYWGWLTVSPDGQVFLYREFTRDYDDPKLTYSDQASEATSRSQRPVIENGEMRYEKEKYDFTVAGVDAWNTHHRDQSGKSLIDYYNQGGATGFIKATTDRILRKAVFHEYLKPYKDPITGKLTARLQVFSTCKTFIELLPQQQEDEKEVEKVMDSSIDHCYDSVGYGIIAYHIQKSKEPPTELTRIQKHKRMLEKRLKRQRRML